MRFDPDQFVRDMRSLVNQGVIFRHQGDDPRTGLDCVNYPRWGYRQQGLDLPAELNKEFEDYSESPDGWRMQEILKKWFLQIPVIDNKVPDARPGDLLQLYVFRNPRHVAVIVETVPIWIVEAHRSLDTKVGKILEQPLDPRRKIAACFRFPDLDFATQT